MSGARRVRIQVGDAQVLPSTSPPQSPSPSQLQLQEGLEKRHRLSASGHPIVPVPVPAPAPAFEFAYAAADADADANASESAPSSASASASGPAPAPDILGESTPPLLLAVRSRRATSVDSSSGDGGGGSLADNAAGEKTQVLLLLAGGADVGPLVVNEGENENENENGSSQLGEAAVDKKSDEKKSESHDSSEKQQQQQQQQQHQPQQPEEQQQQQGTQKQQKTTPDVITSTFALPVPHQPIVTFSIATSATASASASASIFVSSSSSSPSSTDGKSQNTPRIPRHGVIAESSTLTFSKIEPTSLFADGADTNTATGTTTTTTTTTTITSASDPQIEATSSDQTIPHENKEPSTSDSKRDSVSLLTRRFSLARDYNSIAPAYQPSNGLASAAAQNRNPPEFSLHSGGADNQSNADTVAAVTFAAINYDPENSDPTIAEPLAPDAAMASPNDAPAHDAQPVAQSVSDSANVAVSSQPSPSSFHANNSELPDGTPPKAASAAKKSVKFSNVNETRTLPPSSANERRPSAPALLIDDPKAGTWDITDDEDNKSVPPNMVPIPDDNEMFIFENGADMPESAAPRLVTPPQPDADDSDVEETYSNGLSEARDHITPLPEPFISHSYAEAINIALPPDHPDYNSSLANSKSRLSGNKSFVAGSLGSYKGKPLMMPILRDPSVQDRVKEMGHVSSFVGSVDGRSGVDAFDVQSYRASFAGAGASVGAGVSSSFSGRRSSLSASMTYVDRAQAGATYSGTPRSFSVSTGKPLTDKEWHRMKRGEFVVKRQQERQLRNGAQGARGPGSP